MVETAVYDGNKSPSEIEEDIARTRVRLSAAIDALERELAPARVIETSTEVLRNALEPAPGSLRQQVWAYAIPLALIATGLGWLFFLRRQTYEAELPSSFGELPAEAVELGETPTPETLHADLASPAESVALAEQDTAS
jgi:Protein of unknown function (DUF3618)